MSKSVKKIPESFWVVSVSLCIIVWFSTPFIASTVDLPEDSNAEMILHIALNLTPVLLIVLPAFVFLVIRARK